MGRQRRRTNDNFTHLCAPSQEVARIRWRGCRQRQRVHQAPAPPVRLHFILQCHRLTIPSRYEVLNPTPKWATCSSTASRHKRRRLSGESDTSDVSVLGDEANSEDGAEDDDAPTSTRPLAALLRSAEMLTSSSSTSSAKSRLRLRPEVLSIQRLPDISPVQPSPITCISIHPTLPLLLSSGNPSGLLHLHHILPHPIPPLPANPLVTSLHLKHTPLATTAFGPSDTAPRIYMSARRRYFHTWDLATGDISKISRVYGQADVQRSMERLKPSPCGRYVAVAGSSSRGAHVVNVLDAATLQWAAQAALDAPGGLAEFAWWRDGEGMLLVGKGGEVAEWSIAARAVVARWQDGGGVGITTAALGGHLASLRRGAATPVGTDRWVAIGSASGFVNIYDRAAWREGAGGDATNLPPASPRPVKVLENLTTPVSCLAFSPDGQLLCMSSRWKRDALRLVHLPSATVYRNWPTGKTPLGRVSAVAIGEHVERGGAAADGERSMVLVVGNEAGALRMWEIRA